MAPGTEHTGIVAGPEDPGLEAIVRREVTEAYAEALRDASFLRRWILRARMESEIRRRLAGVLRAASLEGPAETRT